MPSPRRYYGPHILPQITNQSIHPLIYLSSCPTYSTLDTPPDRLRTNTILPTQHPHEHKLHDAAVERQELRPSVALRARERLHAAAGGGGGVREEDVFQGTHLYSVPIRKESGN